MLCQKVFYKGDSPSRPDSQFVLNEKIRNSVRKHKTSKRADPFVKHVLRVHYC